MLHSMHLLQVVLGYKSMTNDVLVHLNGMNKMADFSHEEGYLHLCFGYHL